MEVTKLEKGIRVTMPEISSIEVIERQKELLTLSEKKPVKRVILKTIKLKKGENFNNSKILEKHEKLLKIIGFQCSYKNHLDELEAIIKRPLNKRQRAMGGILSTVMDSFNYGVMIGKRMEREKHKRCK